jgi:hypothetical protein
MAKEVYEILGRPVSKEQYEEASKKMDAPQSKVEEDMDDFAKRAKERAAKKTKMKKGGSVDENKLMKKEGRGMAKATMQKVASKAVKGHESRMHKMKSGGTVSSASKRADGIAMKGKTRGRMM